MAFVKVMCYCTTCCMQDWQESALCPSHAACDFSKDTPACCKLLMSPAPITICPCVVFEMCLSLYHFGKKTPWLFYSTFFELQDIVCQWATLKKKKKNLYQYSAIFSLLFLGHLFSFNFSFLLPFMFPLCIPLSLFSFCPHICCVCLFFFYFYFFNCFRYYFPPLDPPRAGTRYGHLLPPSSLIEHCDAEPIQPQPLVLARRPSRALLPLPEAEPQ